MPCPCRGGIEQLQDQDKEERDKETRPGSFADGVTCSSKIEQVRKHINKNFSLSSKTWIQQALWGDAEEGFWKCTFGWYQRNKNSPFNQLTHYFIEAIT